MKIRLQKNTYNYTALAFFLPVLSFFVLMIVRGFIPFGSTSMLYSDMYHQYYPFFLAFRRTLREGKSLQYLWDVGMGMDYLGLIAYYLASPLNLLSVLIPEGLTLHYFSLLAPLKLGFAGLFFGIFLKKLFRKNDLSISLFGCFYAFCAWALGYHWNVMWLDSFALLPLVVLGEICLLRKRKVFLYTFSLFLAILSNYYIGFFVCIFVALVFICYEICRQKSFRRLFSDLGRIALFSALAIGMTAFLELPAFAALQTTQSSINNFPVGMRLNIADSNTWLGLFDAMRQVAGNSSGGITPNFVSAEALPNIYCGIVANVFAFLFLTCKQVRLRDKICSVAMLLFLNVSFIVRQLDYIWHGFHFTNMIPYRFSFLYSFVLLYMAYRAYLLRRSFKLWQIITAGALSVGLVLCSGFPDDLSFWAYNIIFLFLYLGILLYPVILPDAKDAADPQQQQQICTERKDRRRLCGVLLSVVMALELGINLVNFGVEFAGTTVMDYPRGAQYTASMISYMKERSERMPFYRTEVTSTQTLNDGALNGYNGITAFTSSADVHMTRYMQVLGLGAKDTYNRYSYTEGSPVTNLFLNLRYMLEREALVKNNQYFTDVHHYGNVHLLENNAYLPLGFLADSHILNIDFDTAYQELTATQGNWNRLAFQNKLFSLATGQNSDVWDFLTGSHLSISATDVTLTSSGENGRCSYHTDDSKNGSVVYKYIADKDGYLCLDLYIGLYNTGYNPKNNYSLWKNSVEISTGKYSLAQIIGVDSVVAGDVIELHVGCNAGEDGTIRVNAGILDDAVFQKGYDILSASTLTVTDFQETYISGEIDCNRNGVLYTSIPQNGNWSVYVDGEPARAFAFGNATVALLLSKGSHTVTFLYRNHALTTGLIVSVISLTAFLILYFSAYRKKQKRKPKKGKFSRENRLSR